MKPGVRPGFQQTLVQSARRSEQDSLRAERAHEKRLKRFSFSGWRRSLTVAFPVQSGGLESPLGRETKAKGWTTYGFPPFGNPFSLSVRYTFQLPIGRESMNPAQRVRAVRRSRLCWHCIVTKLHFSINLHFVQTSSAIRTYSPAIINLYSRGAQSMPRK